ncbi:MAG TPA: gephyrin-like molybdotransferase receptor GlpR [Pseudonocardia sp.]
MPSSMIFASLVVLWLLILVPAVAGHRQEVARPSVAALSGRVLTRPPRRRSQEVEGMGERDGDDETRDGRVLAARTREVQVPRARAELRPDEIGAASEEAEQADEADEVDEDAPDESYAADWAEDDEADDHAWERPPPRYRAGRGGFDAEAAALAAKARYTFRQRVVLLMLVAALATGIVAAVAVRSVWWAHGAIDVLLVGYLVYLRRQVRLEEAIRARRAARMAGTRRQSAAEDPELDEWAERGREAVRGSEPAEDIAATTRPRWREMPAEDAEDDTAGRDESADARPAAASASLPSPPVVAAPVVEEEPRALPRLHPTPPPPLPPGTTLVEDADDELDLDDGGTPGYRRAAGQ